MRYKIVLLFIIIFSCSYADGNLTTPERKGEIDGVFGLQDAVLEMKMYRTENVIDIDIREYEENDEKLLEFEKGSYFVRSDNSFKAVAVTKYTRIKGDLRENIIDHYPNQMDADDIEYARFKITLEGWLLWHDKTTGEGNYTMECRYYLKNGTIITDIFKDDCIILGY